MTKNKDLKSTELFPKFLIMLFFTEMWERFSYYGMRALLVLFLTSHLEYNDVKAYSIYSLFAAISYASPVVGGIIADKLAGFRNMVVLGGIIITLGHTSLALINLSNELLYLGLALVALGTGMFKGNITNLLGSCYNGYKPEERTKGFNLFYVGVNVGSLLASVTCGYIASIYGWHYGFGVAGLGMIIGLIIFIKFQEELLGQNGLSQKPELMQKKVFGMKPFAILLIVNLLSALFIAKMLMLSELFANALIVIAVITLVILGYILAKLPAAQLQNLIALLTITVFFMLFFALEMQLGSLIALFTERNVTHEVLGLMVPSSVFQSINPFSVITLGLVFSALNIPKKYSTMMFTFGLSTMAICFLTLYMGCINHIAGKVSSLYLIVAISFIGLGEVCIGPLVLEQATQLAPKHLRGMVMGIIMLSLAFSNLAGILISKFMSVPTLNGEINCLQSLDIYKQGFFTIAMYNIGFVCLFLLFYRFVHKTIISANQQK